MNVIIGSPADLGAAVRRARRDLGLSQEVAAAAAGVGTRFLVELEGGKASVQLDRVLAVLTALDMRLEVADALQRSAD